MTELTVTLAVSINMLISSFDPAACHNFERLQSIILSEATRQPLEAQIEVARVVITKGPCFLDPHWLSGYGVALEAESLPPDQWRPKHRHHWPAYADPGSFPAGVRESAALAAHLALSESPPVSRYHFDAASAPLVWWWHSPKACPNGFWEVADLRVC